MQLKLKERDNRVYPCMLHVSAGIIPMMLLSHTQSDMTQPVAALTWWFSDCGGSINKHYLSSRTSNRARPSRGIVRALLVRVLNTCAFFKVFLLCVV